jgi:3-deoxy-7-phosphoheptulonate synthase
VLSTLSEQGDIIPISNAHIESHAPLSTPDQVKEELPLTDKTADNVVQAREAVARIIAQEDDRHLVVVGPCSIHCEDSAKEYAERLCKLNADVADRMLLVMRVYFEKPRTTVGWKGLIYDPDLDNTYNIEKGIRLVRRILLDVNELGVPAAVEMLDPVTPQYTADLVTWAAIGARTSESQTHRQLASGLSMPVGFKNATDGSMQVAVDAVKTAASKHSFIGVTDDGRTGVFNTTGNKHCHVVLRGGSGKPNYGSEHIAYARELLKKAGLTPSIMVDCSHDNSAKQPERQVEVMKDVVAQVTAGDRDIIGTMLESNLRTGRQDMTDRSSIEPDLSITDACLGWQETEELLRQVYADLARS